MPLKIKKMKTLKRIQEYEKFEANCQMIKELEKDRRTNVSKNVLDWRNTIMVDEAKNTQEKRANKPECFSERLVLVLVPVLVLVLVLLLVLVLVFLHLDLGLGLGLRPNTFVVCKPNLVKGFCPRLLLLTLFCAWASLSKRYQST